MSYLLNVVYVVLLVAVSPWLLYQAISKGKYREGFAEKLLGRVPRRGGNRPCVWFHAVSVGEVNLLATLIEQFQREHPTWDCVISTTTMTGYALARTKYPELAVFYSPLDFSWAVAAAMRRIRPDLLVLVELELWPNLIRAARAHGAKVALAGGRLSGRSFRGYRWLRPVIGRTLASLDLVAAQSETYAERFRRLGARDDAVHVSGSLKFDGASTDRDNPLTRRLRTLAGLAERDVVFLAGSTQEPEEAHALQAYGRVCEQHPRLRLVLVPRHPDRFDAVAGMIEDAGFACLRRSDMGRRLSPPSEQSSPDEAAPAAASPVLLVDTIGELAAWWGTATVAYVGGSMGRRGGQNMIEPAAYGAAVSFGPHTENFRDVVAALLADKAAVVVRDEDELTAFVERSLTRPDEAAEMGRRARAFVQTQLGATGRTLQLLGGLLSAATGTQRGRRAA